MRNLELIGEAAINIPDEVRQKYAQIPWRMVVATRNRLIHGYLGIDNDTLWSIIKTDIPVLLVELRMMKMALSK
ncbi:HepT-like ribonuclease domain-containing protein [Sideroxydans sp. CL21]|uniref:HepT-like ribonuclease domain-containing protein n=1 Tax=Sideroxydans sp. CL21 TaxID=2600596 RepID=UPI0024BBF4DA|nr:HepT-like ribonuclease domain-containing protein [Sideroxydans sp. CL21]